MYNYEILTIGDFPPELVAKKIDDKSVLDIIRHVQTEMGKEFVQILHVPGTTMLVRIVVRQFRVSPEA